MISNATISTMICLRTSAQNTSSVNDNDYAIIFSKLFVPKLPPQQSLKSLITCSSYLCWPRNMETTTPPANGVHDVSQQIGTGGSFNAMI